MITPVQLSITTQSDIEQARRRTRTLVTFLGFRAEDAEAIVLAVSELATNLVRYAKNGEIVVSPLDRADGIGIQIESHDSGPGIADVNRAMEDGFSTGQGLGSGLPSVPRLMDEFEINTGPTGTKIEARKWHSTR